MKTIFVLPILFLLFAVCHADSATNVVLTLEKSIGGLTNWTAVPVSPSMIATNGRLDGGLAVNSSNTFYRMRIDRAGTNSFRGIYMGTHTFGGKWATFVRADNTATTVVTDTSSPGSMIASSYQIQSDGSFSALMGDSQITFQGSFSNGSVTGQVKSLAYGTIGTFDGTRKPDEGDYAYQAGVWVATWGDTNRGTASLVGIAVSIAAADGSFVAHTAGEGTLRDGVASIMTSNGFATNTVRGILLNSPASSNASKTITGTYNRTYTNSGMGSFSARLVEPY
jgi:hypothetical protein